MHRNKHKPDKEATKTAHFISRYSYVSFRIHPDTEHPCVYLAGDDCGVARARIYQRSKGHCENTNCQIFVSEFTAEMDHIQGKRKAVRCWCDENLQILCQRCHRRKTGRDVVLRNIMREASV